MEKAEAGGANMEYVVGIEKMLKERMNGRWKKD